VLKERSTFWLYAVLNDFLWRCTRHVEDFAYDWRVQRTAHFFPPRFKNSRLFQEDAREASTVPHKVLDKCGDRSHDYETGGRHVERSLCQKLSEI